MGLPPSGGFTAKWLLLTAAIDSGQWAWALVMAAGGLFAAGYIYRVIAPALAPPHEDSLARPTPGPSSGAALALGLALLAVMLGFAPPEVSRFLLIGAPGAKSELVK
jgi:NADH:ubiquinone oxidoreductase subunit 2 (subunit N)